MFRQLSTVTTMSAGSCGGWPTPASVGVPLVYSNFLPVVTIGMLWNAHCAGEWCHTQMTVTGAIKTYAGFVPVVRMGDIMSCGDMPIAGSSKVFA